MSFALLMVLAAPAFSQPAVTKYKVTLRYYIPAPRDVHVIHYDSMIRHLQQLKFEFDPPLDKHLDTDRENRGKNYIEGAIAADKALKLLDHPVVQTIQLTPLEPVEFKLPKEADDPVSVRLELAGNLMPERQRELANQTRLLLRELGFKEPAGYDHRGYSKRIYTRIVGAIPNGKLDLLRRDLRYHPAGWLGPIIPRDEMPTPLREANPVRVIEILPDTEAVKELPEPDLRLPEQHEKISPDLWELVQMKDVPKTPIRVQIALVGAKTAEERAWILTLQELAPGFFLEGQLGSFVTGIMRLDQVKTLAMSPLVSVIRLPRAPRVDIDPAVKIKGDNKRALEQTGLAALHKKGERGQDVRLAIIDRDFRGWEDLVKKKLLPVRTRLVDLTIERDADLYPQPYPPEPGVIGHGTLCAQAAAWAAPEAEIVLVRVEAGDPFQLAEIARYVRGGAHSQHLEHRNGELVARAAQLQARREYLLRERANILEDFTDDTDLKRALEFLGPFYSWLYSDRDWHRTRMELHERLEAEHRQREERYRALLKGVASLEGTPIIVNALAFNSGYPLGAASALSRLLDDQRGPLWFQAAGNSRGQAWHGLFRSIPGDPAMKFSDDATPLPKGRWSSEVNFLAWRPHGAEGKPGLPEKTKLRLTLQWREPHDPDYYLRPDDEDHYRRPLANLRVQLLRQRDPEQKALPADLFELVARTSGWPQRLEHLPTSSIYELVLEAPLPKEGRYAIRVERQPDSQWFFAPHPVRRTPTFQYISGLAPTGIRPLGVPTLSALEKDWDLRPRIYVEVLDEPTRLQGRAVFVDYPTDSGSIGLPADARNVISVGAADFRDKPQSYSAFGSPPAMGLATRPTVYAYDELELAGGGAWGTTVANAFAAGTTAALLSGGATREEVMQLLWRQEGRVLRVPNAKD